MKFVALLRGINVGGKKKVEMPRLKSLFEHLGYTNVATYINSGNVLFEAAEVPAGEAVMAIEKAIAAMFGHTVPVLIRSQQQLAATVAVLHDDWVNNSLQKCDICFLWNKFDKPDVLTLVGGKSKNEDVIYAPGVIIWRVDRQFINQGQFLKIIGTDLYKHMTIRNANTVRKLLQLMNQA